MACPAAAEVLVTMKPKAYTMKAISARPVTIEAARLCTYRA